MVRICANMYSHISPRVPRPRTRHRHPQLARKRGAWSHADPKSWQFAGVDPIWHMFLTMFHCVKHDVSPPMKTHPMGQIGLDRRKPHCVSARAPTLTSAPALMSTLMVSRSPSNAWPPRTGTDTPQPYFIQKMWRCFLLGFPSFPDVWSNVCDKSVKPLNMLGGTAKCNGATPLPECLKAHAALRLARQIRN